MLSQDNGTHVVVLKTLTPPS